MAEISIPQMTTISERGKPSQAPADDVCLSLPRCGLDFTAICDIMKPKDINEIREITMDWEKELYDENEKPLDRLVEGYSNTSIFRKIAFVGDSLSSGEFERVKEDGKKDFHDMYEYSWGQHIARRNGLTAYSFSKGGMTAKEYCESFAEEKGF